MQKQRDDEDNLSYSDAVALLRERNRPSGGIRTVHEVAKSCFISPLTRVLEIGSNTGFTSVNLSLLTGCNVTGVDLNSDAIAAATEYARNMGVSARTHFIAADATELPFKTETFDVTWASNVTSFIESKKLAIMEYVRVLKRLGFLVMVPIYYKRQPPAEIVQAIERAIKTPLTVRTKDDWIKLCKDASSNAGVALEIVFNEDYEYLDQSARLDSFCVSQFNKPHVRDFPEYVQQALLSQYPAFIKTFNENLKFCGFSILIMQSRPYADEEELFTTRRAP